MANRLFQLMRKRQEFSDTLPQYTLRNDPRLDVLGKLDDEIRAECAQLRVTEHDAWAVFNNSTGEKQ